MLSLLVPVYNYNVTELIESLHTQCTESNIAFEIIIVDDGSQKDFITQNEKLTVLPDCRFMVNEQNLGRTMTRKKLAELAQYETLLFLDADVIPVSKDYIKNYIPYIKKEYPVVFGGVFYKDETVSREIILRHKYGRYREQKDAAYRNTIPYSTVFSANLMIDRQVFLKNNYSGSNSFYGMDNYFSYMLYRNNIRVHHIDNPVYHIGLEENSIFFEKCLKSVRIRKELLSKEEDIESINSLLKHYKNLKKYHLAGVVSFFFKIGEPVLKKMILSKNPNLFSLDLYRLGYICSL
mgnify:CR=1 FL=1